MFFFSRTILCALFMLLLATTASAQFKAGVQGTVTDASGAIVPATTVTLTSNETNKSQQTTASDEGFYRFTSLAPGRYTLTAEQANFKKQVLDNVVVEAENVQGVDIVMEAGGISETVTVSTATDEGLQTENANVDRQISTQEVRRLPQSGRDPYELLRLTPGIFGDAARGGTGGAVGLPNSTGPGGSNSSVFQVENQPQISANGQRVSANNFQIDGVSVNSLTYGGAAVVTPNQESVKEVSVVSSSYTAEDGRNSGAQIKVVSQNGTNNFHGSAFLKYNSPKLNAFNKYGPGYGRTGPERVNNLARQFGGSLGGPIVHDKLFFFTSYEGSRNNSSNTTLRYLETPQFRQLVQTLRPGSIAATIFGSQGIEPRIAGQTTPTCALIYNNDATRCRVVAGGLDIGSPSGARGQYLANGSFGGGFDGIPDIAQYVISSPQRFRGNQFNGRIDYNHGSNDQFAVSTYFTPTDTLGSDESSGARPLDDLETKPLNTAVTFTYNRIISSSTINEARFNLTRFAFNGIESSATTNFGIPRIEIEGLPTDRVRFGAPQSETTPAIFAQNTFEFRDTLSKLVGNHGLKFGIEVRKEQDNNNLNGGSRPLYTFGGPFNLANDAPLFYQINADPTTGGPANAARNFRTSTYAGFVQDDWKFRPNITFNIGLRYEYFTPLSEKNGILSNFVSGSNGISNGQVVVAKQLFEPDRNNFGPRLGFAYSPKYFEDKAVVRGGFGISYNRVPNVLFANTRGNPPFFARFQICCGTSGSPFAGGQILYALGSDNSPFSFPANPALAQGIDPNTGAPRGAGITAAQVEVYGSEPNIPNAYVYSYSLDMDYQLPYRLVATAGYQGSAGHHFIRLVNEKFLHPTPGNFFASAVFFPQPDVNTNYNAMNLRLSRKFAQGFQFDAVYRWAKSIDNLSNEGPGAETNQTYPQDNRTERGPSDYDVRHNFVLSGLWDLPFFRNRHDTIGKAFGGFQLNGILTYHTGFPYTVKTGRVCPTTPGGPNLCPSRPVGYFGGSGNDTSNEAFMNGTSLRASSFDITHAGPPGIGRNSFRGPRFFSVDMSAAKRTGLPSFLHLGEGAYFEFKVNAFNVFNQLNLAPFRFYDAGLIVEDGNFGRIERGLSGRVVELQARFSF
jgi:hypothetical protein